MKNNARASGQTQILPSFSFPATRQLYFFFFFFIKATRMVRLSKIMLTALLIVCFIRYVKPDSPDHCYNVGDTVPIYANTIGPFNNPQERYDYYDFPFCSPDTMNEKNNLGKMLTGERLVSTPYMISFRVDKHRELVCKKRLRKTDVSLFRSMIKNGYDMRLYYDDLPINGYIGRVEMKNKYYLYNLFEFFIFYNKDQVIEVRLKDDSNSEVDVTEDKEIDVNFTYSVWWELTDRTFDERLNYYTTSTILPHHTSVHGYSIVNSCFTILLVIICLLIFYIRVLRKDISKYASDVEEVEMVDKQEETGWKSIHGDVFRFPKHKSLFAAALGSSSQLLALMVGILILGVIGVFQTYFQGVFLKALAIVYALTSVISGYTSSSFYRQLEGTEQMKNLLLTGGLYFGPFFITFGFNNIFAVLSGETETCTLPTGSMIMLSLVWIFVALPLLLLGGFFGTKSVSDFKAPCRTAKCPREVPRARWYKGIVPQMVLAGFLPFSVINIQIYDNLVTVWDHGIYTFYNSMSIMFFLLLIITSLVSVVMTYSQLAAENHEWWWRSFLCGGSTGLYVYGYGIYYYFYVSFINNSFVQTVCFFGYMACLSYGIFLALGTVGFHASLFFVRYLYASIKCD